MYIPSIIMSSSGSILILRCFKDLRVKWRFHIGSWITGKSAALTATLALNLRYKFEIHQYTDVEP